MPEQKQPISPDNWPKPNSPLPTSRASSSARTVTFAPKISPEAVREIRRLGRRAKKLAKAEGRKGAYPGFTKRLADQYGVTQRCIQLIIKGQRQTGKKNGRPKASR